MPLLKSFRTLVLATVAIPALTAPGWADPITYFTAGDLVVSTVSDQVGTGTGLDTASPITLDQFDVGSGGTSVNLNGTLTLPQAQNGANYPISGEYGSASEGFLEQSVNGQYLTIMGYGVPATAFNTAATSVYGTAALGQTTSLTGQTVTTVPRVVALIGTTGSVDTSTALTGVFNQNNPRSAATVDGSAFYVSGQGQTGDGTGGVFYAVKGATTATPIDANTTTPTGADTVNPAFGTETRAVEILNTGSGNTLWVSRDYSPSGTPNDSTDIRTLAGADGNLPTTSVGLVATRQIAGSASGLGGNTSSINVTAATENGVNDARLGKFVYLSPEQFFLANPTTMYVTDSGSPKNGSAGAAADGEGGLQKWSLIGGVWTLDYDLVSGLDLVNSDTANSNTPTAAGVTGLFGLTGQVEPDGTVELFATSYGLNELSPSYLYEITDTLSDTTISEAADETFNTLYSAPAGTSVRGVAFAPVPEPASLALLAVGLAGVRCVRRRRMARSAIA